MDSAFSRLDKAARRMELLVNDTLTSSLPCYCGPSQHCQSWNSMLSPSREQELMNCIGNWISENPLLMNEDQALLVADCSRSVLWCNSEDINYFRWSLTRSFREMDFTWFFRNIDTNTRFWDRRGRRRPTLYSIHQMQKDLVLFCAWL